MKGLKHVHILECPNHLVPCTIIVRSNFGKHLKTCGDLIQRCELNEHMTLLCEWRQVECTHCNLKGTHHFITGDHTKVCREFSVPCTIEGCEIKVKRKNLSEHKKSCPKQIVSCRYSSVGCKARITRENIVSHNQECMDQHLDSAVDKLDRTSDKLDRAVNTLERTCTRLEHASKRISELEATLNIKFCLRCRDYHAEYTGSLCRRRPFWD